MNNYEDKTDDGIVISAEHISDQYDLRDYFAAKAIQGRAKYGEYPTDLMIGQLVGNAYKIANAMLKERDKEVQGGT